MLHIPRIIYILSHYFTPCMMLIRDDFILDIFKVNLNDNSVFATTFFRMLTQLSFFAPEQMF